MVTEDSRVRKVDPEDITAKNTEEKPEAQRPEPVNSEKPRSTKKELIDWIKVIVIAVAAAALINCFIIINSVVPSGSMESTIMTGSRMFGFRLAYLFNEPEQGDVIIFRYPVNEKQVFVKRVIGTPGDTVEIIGGVTYVNGEKLEEPYLNEEPYKLDFGPYEVPEDCFFVMGDNRNHSNDSRYWERKETDENGREVAVSVSFVTRREILARAFICYWPINRIGIIK